MIMCTRPRPHYILYVIVSNMHSPHRILHFPILWGGGIGFRAIKKTVLLGSVGFQQTSPTPPLGWIVLSLSFSFIKLFLHYHKHFSCIFSTPTFLQITLSQNSFRGSIDIYLHNKYKIVFSTPSPALIYSVLIKKLHLASCWHRITRSSSQNCSELKEKTDLESSTHRYE